MNTPSNQDDKSDIKSNSHQDSDVNNNHKGASDDDNNKSDSSSDSTALEPASAPSPHDIAKPLRPTNYRQHSHKLSVSFSEAEVQVQHQVAQHQLSIHRQNSIRLSSYKKKQSNDLESRLNRMYSFILVKYHWAILLFGLFTCLVLTGVGFVKQPLPNFLDPKKGFGARGDGTLTSKLIVMKNINKELIKYQSYILDTYEQVKIANRSDYGLDTDSSGGDYAEYGNYTYEDYEDYEDYDDYAEDEDYMEYEDIWSNNEDNNNGGSKAGSNNKELEEDEEYEDYKLKKTKLRRRRNAANKANENIIKASNLGNELRFLDDKLFKGLTGKQILEMMPMEINFMNKSKIQIDQRLYSFKSIEHCEVSLGLNSNLEFYFQASDSIEVSEAKDLEKYEWQAKNPDKADQFYADIDSEYSTRTDTGFDFRHVQSDPEQIEQMKLEYIDEKVKNLLNLKNLRSLCQWNRQFLAKIAQTSRANKLPDQTPCHFSLPDVIALLNGKDSCMDLTADDVRHFLEVARQCYPLQKNGVLFWAAEDSKKKSEMDSLLHKNDPVGKFMALGFVNQNVCFKNNLMHIVFEFLVDRNFMELDDLKVAQAKWSAEKVDSDSDFSLRSYNIRKSVLLILNDKKIERNASGSLVPNVNGERMFQSEFMFNFYLESLNKQTFDDEVTRLAGINLMGLREEAAMRLISQEMTLVALAILLIVAATLLYLKSAVISMMINLTVGLSIGVSFFAYRIVFDIELFPFLNMMAAFLLLGIACDDVFVLFDSWYNEKAKVIMEDLPEMIEKQYNAMNISPEPMEPTVHGSQIVNSGPVEEYLLPPMFIERKFINSYNDDRDDRIRHKQDLTASKSALPPVAETAEELNESSNFIHSNKTLSLRKNSEINIQLEDASISLERLNDYMLNPGYIHAAVLTDEQLMRAMSGTLRHAASSIFVTSFTTAAAFLSNYITKLPYVQLFGFFTGSCILVKFIMVLTMVFSFVITFEKHINLWRCKLKPRFADKWERLFNRVMDKIALINYCIISKNLPKLLIRFRFVFFSIGVLLGVCGMVAVFYKPKLSPPSNWKYQFFADGNHFENFEFKMKDHFLSYVNEEKRNLTNPEVFFVFGIIGKDNGDIFNPDDDGHLVYDKHFDFLDQGSQIWLNDFINKSIASHPELFLGKQIVQEWNDYLLSIQQLCWKTLGLDAAHIFTPKIPYGREGLSKCREEIASFMQNSSVRNFESMMASFPRRIIFIAQGNEVTGILLRINANRTFSSYEVVSEYFEDVLAFSDHSIRTAPKGFNTGWFVSVGFALYDLQSQLISGTYSSLVFSMSVALIILLLTSGNVLISLLAIITISFSIADTIAIFVFLGWKLDILESVVIIMSVGLSVDFSCHYGVAYINADVHSLTDTTLSSIFEPNLPIQKSTTNVSNQVPATTTTDTSEPKALKASDASPSSKSHCKLSSFFNRVKAQYRHADKERFVRVEDIFSCVGSAVLMASVTTFLAGSSMFPSGLISFSKMGQFLMLVMFTSYMYATFFFVPMCAIFGPTKNFGKLNLKKMFQRCLRRCCGRKANSNQDVVCEIGGGRRDMPKVKVPLTIAESNQSP